MTRHDFHLVDGSVRLLPEGCGHPVADDASVGAHVRAGLAPVPDQPREVPAPGVADTVKGVVGLAKDAVGADRVDVETRDARWSVCSSCREFVAGKCAACGCNLPAKVRLRTSSCPKGKW